MSNTVFTEEQMEAINELAKKSDSMHPIVTLVGRFVTEELEEKRRKENDPGR